jgi:GntR family transcriptional regulator
MEQVLKSKLISGEFSPGDQIPTEKELCNTYQVSNITVKKALSNLVNEGLLDRKPGKGTFVTGKISDIIELQHGISTNDILPDGIEKQEVKVLDITHMKASTKVARILKIRKGDEIVRVTRTRSVNNIPISLTINSLPLALGERIKKENLKKYPMLHILEKKLKIPIVGALQEIKAIVADHAIASSLSINICSPILYLEFQIFTRREKPVEFVQIYNRSDLVKIINDLRLKKTGLGLQSKLKPTNELLSIFNILGTSLK